MRDGDEIDAAHLREDMQELETRVNAGQAAVLARLDSQDATLAGQNTMLAGIADSIGKISTTLGTHDQFVHEKQEEEAERDRVEAEQAMRERLLTEIDAKRIQRVQARKARWGKVSPYLFGVLATVAGGSVLWVLENLNHLRWDIQTQWIATVLAFVALALVLLYRIGP